MSAERFKAVDWQQLQARHQALEAELTAGINDNQLRSERQRELANLTELLTSYQAYQTLENELVGIERQLQYTPDPELAALFQEELAQLTARIPAAEAVLDDLLFPPDELDSCNAYLEIRAGAGGQEAALFAYDLLRLYTNYALSQGWQLSLMSASQTDLKGFKEVVAHITGKNVYGQLKRESGVHRVQRVPATEASGRVHTSTVTVAVLPEVQDEAVTEIAPTDLRIDYFRASGAGGQHVNTTESAVRITHLPTGIVVSCQDERSQHKNKAKAMKSLQSRILVEQLRQREEQMRDQRRLLVGTGMRSEKVRTYNYPQNRVTDHQINLTLNKLDIVMEGALQEIVAGLQQYDRELRRAAAIAKLQTK